MERTFQVWKIVTRCEDLANYIACASAWLDVLLRHYSEREVVILLRDIVRHVDVAEPARLELSMRNLEHLVTVLVQRCTNFGGALLTSEYLLKARGFHSLHIQRMSMGRFLLPHGSCWMCSSRRAKLRYRKPSLNRSQGHTSPQMIRSSSTLCLTSRVLCTTRLTGLHSHGSNLESVSCLSRGLNYAAPPFLSLSPEGEQRHISSLICGFVNKAQQTTGILL